MKKIKNWTDLFKFEDGGETFLLITALISFSIAFTMFILKVFVNLSDDYFYYIYLLSIYAIFTYIRISAVQTRKKYLLSLIFIRILIYLLISLVLILMSVKDDDFLITYIVISFIFYISIWGSFFLQFQLLGNSEYKFVVFLNRYLPKINFLYNLIDIVLLVVIIFVLVIFPKDKMSMLTTITFIILIIPMLFIRKNDKIILKLESFNLKYNMDIEKIPVYIYNRKIISNSSYFKMFKLDFEDAFPQGASEKEIIIYNYVCLSDYMNDKKNNSFYFCIPRKQKDYTICLKVYQKYKLNKLENQKKFDLYVEIKNYNGELVPITNGMIFNETTAYINRNYHYRDYKIDFKNTYSTNKYIIDSVLINGRNLNRKVSDDRRFLKHDGSYGNGKTTSDIYMIASANRIPVIISPWEENYDHDFLYLVFKKLKYSTNTISHSFNMEYIVFYLTLLIATYTFVLSNEEDIYSLLMPDILLNYLTNENKLWIIESWLIYLIYIPLLVLFIIKRIIPYLIVFKKDYSKIYQDFFIDEIYNMLQMNPDICLLIEDIDRLNETNYKDVFRILSAINKKFKSSNRIIGLLSYASENIKDEVIYDLENKICYKEIRLNSESHKQKIEFVKNILFHNHICEKRINDILVQIDEFLKQITFRDLNQLIDECFVKQNHFKVYLFYDNLRYIAKKKEEEKQKISSSSQIQNNIMVNM